MPVRYLVRSGRGWRMLPIHFGPWQTVYGWFRELARRFLFQAIHDLALMVDRERAGRQASPSAGVIDSQSVKAPQGQTRGSAETHGQGRLPRLRYRGHPPFRRPEGLQDPAGTMGGRTHLRLDPMAASRARL